MLYFKHSQLAEDYKVSLKTIHNWIDAAKQGKLELQLHEENSRTYIANTPANNMTLDRLALKGKKYRNSLHQKIVSPRPVFYETYNTRQVLDIISDLNIHREIPQQYSYFDGGAHNWVDWVEKMKKEKASNALNGTVELLQTNLGAFDQLLRGREKVNIIDLGVGDAQPVKDLLAHLLERGILNRYIAIDTSQSMLDVAKDNIVSWFGDKVKYEGHVRDVRYERFDDLLLPDALGEDYDRIINVVLFLGGTRSNFRAPNDCLKVIQGSMGEQDLFIYTGKPDTEVSRRYFNFNPQEEPLAMLPPLDRFVLEMLGIDQSLYQTEMGFSEQHKMRYIRVRLKYPITIHFSSKEIKREVVLEKNETILVWRAWHWTTHEMISDFESAGLTLVQASLTRDRQYLLTICGVVTDSTGEI
jgi:uncharacterized SAM-dependent methyltransferase